MPVCSTELLGAGMSEKMDYWKAQIGKTINAKGYRDNTATGTLLGVGYGLWGYGGDSVALELDVADHDGTYTWPAGLCEVAPNAEVTSRPTQRAID